MKSFLEVIKQNFIHSKIALLITVLVVLLATTSPESSIAISRGNYTWLFILMLPFFVIFGNFRKLINLNASKKSYYIGSILTYVVSAFFVSLINTIIHLTLDNISNGQTVINLMDVCKWTQNGIFIAFIQQFFFLLLVSLFLHTLLSMQTKWYGWITDIVIIAIICIFIPIAPLREVLVNFFGLIMINSNAILNIVTNIIICIILYFIGLGILKNKSI